MKRIFKQFFLLIAASSIFLGCSNDEDATIENIDIIQEKNSEDTYEDFTETVYHIRENLSKENFTHLQEQGEKLNRSFTSFPNYISLDTRKTDAVNDDRETPSKYEFYYINNEKTIIVKTTFIYNPGSEKTKILSLNSVEASRIDKDKDNIKDIFPIVYTSYLISIKNALVEIDFYPTENINDTQDIYSYILSEGEEKFLPAFEAALNQK